MSTTYKTKEQWIKDETAALKSQADASVAASAGVYDTQAQNTQNTYNKQIADTKTSYEDLFKSNETQRFINARAVERRAAEMGLTDSGLNRTQQTAVQLSAANNAAKLTRQQQSAIDTLAAALSADLSTIYANKAAAKQDILNTYNDRAYSQGTAAYENQQDRISAETIAATEAEATKYAADVAAQNAIDVATITANAANEETAEEENPLTYNFYGVTKADDYGNTVNIYRGSDGKEYTAMRGYNIYTGTNNLLTYAAEAKDPTIGFFSNGYQPKGLVSEGGKFSATTAGGGQVLQYNMNGKPQTIWKSPNNNYFIWDGYKNAYQKVPLDFVKQVAAQDGLELDTVA